MMSDGACTLAKFFSIQSRKSLPSVEQHCINDDQPVSVPELKVSEELDIEEVDVIEYEDFLNELKTTQSDAENISQSTNESYTESKFPPADIAELDGVTSDTNDNADTKDVRSDEKEEIHEKEAEEASSRNQSNSNTTTLLKFFTVTGRKDKPDVDYESKEEQVHSEETKKRTGRTKTRKNNNKELDSKSESPQTEDISTEDADTVSSESVPATIDAADPIDKISPVVAADAVSCEEMECTRNVPSTDESGVEDADVTSCAMNTSTLSDRDVSRLINNSLIEAGIIGSSHSVKEPSLVVVSSDDSHLPDSPLVCTQVTEACVDSPASSVASSSRISLRDVRRRLRERKLLSEKVVKSAISKKSKVKKEEVVDSSETLTERRRSSRKKSAEDQSCSPAKHKAPRLKKVKTNQTKEEAVGKRKAKKGKKKRPKIADDELESEPATDAIKVISVSTDDDNNPEVTSSQSSTPARLKRRPRRSTPKVRKKRRLSDEDIVMVSAVNSPSTTLREERLARLHAMSSKDDYSNLKQSKAIVPLTQAEFFPKIGHVTQLPQDEETYDCRLKLLPAEPHTDITCNQTTLGLSIQRNATIAAHKPRKGRLSTARVKKELMKLQALLPHYPVDDVYDILDSRVCEEGEGDQLWTSKYSPSTLSQLLVRKGYIEVINEWLLNWKKDIIKGQSSTRKKTKKKSNKKRNQFINDSDSEESGDELTHTPILVLSGASGLGKTTCAYTIASLLGFKVFEMNPSMLRTSRTVMERVHESTRSQQVQKGKGVSIDSMFDSISQDAGTKPVRGIASFFTQIKKKGESKEEAKSSTTAQDKTKAKHSGKVVEASDAIGSCTSAVDGAEAVSLSKLSLILFDEADVAFEEDRGFYETIKSLGLEAKKPIILTCQSTGYLRSIGVEHTHVLITPHIDLEIAIYLCIVSLAENEVADVNAMLQLVNKFNCDIRKCILHIQYLISSGGLQSRASAEEEKCKTQRKPTHLSPVRHLARMCSHQSTLDILATHHHRRLIHGSHSIRKLSSNPSRVSIDTGVVTRVSMDPVTWSSVRTIKSVYTELIKGSFNVPKSKRLHGSELVPAKLMLSIREELPPYIVSLSDKDLSLDFLPFFNAVCLAENERKESKISRRFLHYLAKQGLYLSDNDQACIVGLFRSSPDS